MPGPGEVLDLIRAGRATTRGEVLDQTGLARMSVATRIDALLGAGILVEQGAGATTGGRRPKRLAFNTDRADAVVAVMDTTHTTVAVTDLAANVRAERHIDAVVADGPERTLTAIEHAAAELLAELGVPRERLAGVAASVPGPVDPATGRPSQPPIMPGWDAYPVADHLADALGAPALVANDADAAALGEQRTAHRDSRALCFVKVSTGIGTGIVIDGRVYQGVDGGAGDIGHVKLAGHDDAVCHCGARGCLAAVASGHAVARALAASGVEAHTGSDVGSLLAAGNAAAAHETQRAGRLIGEVLATVVSVVNPGQVVIGGRLASTALIAGVRETLYPRSLPRATRNLDISLSTLGERASIVGLVALLVEREYSAAVVNTALGW